jgi:L-ascorbate metabolism protein UlaG (beta-lactamase superfamily)
MTITWLGQSCFKIEDKEVRIITDPFEAAIGLKPPRVEADIVTISHDHTDHNNLEAIKGSPFVIKGPGEYEVKSVFVYGIPSFHDKSEGRERGANTLYLIEMEDIKIAHLGDLGQSSLTDEQLESLDGVDILLVPVGGVYTINAKEAVDIINQIEPRIVIPMHYKVPGLKIGLDGLDKFCKEIGICKKEAVEKLKISKKDLPVEEMDVITMKL